MWKVFAEQPTKRSMIILKPTGGLTDINAERNCVCKGKQSEWMLAGNHKHVVCARLTINSTSKRGTRDKTRESDWKKGFRIDFSINQSEFLFSFQLRNERRPRYKIRTHKRKEIVLHNDDWKAMIELPLDNVNHEALWWRLWELENREKKRF